MRNIAIFPGTFDPVTLGHVNIIERAAPLVEKLFVAIGNNSLKIPLFTVQERSDMLNEVLNHLNNVEVIFFDRLLVDIAKKKQVRVIIRAIRSFLDFENELCQGHMNKKMSGLETLYLAADEKHRWIHSSLIREIGLQGGSLTHFVPPVLEKKIAEKLLAIGRKQNK